MNGLRAGLIVLLFVALGSPVAGAYPGGGGGVEYLTTVGTSTLARLGLPTKGLLDLPPGTVHGFGGFGYAVARRGWKFGGFGTVLFANGLSLSIPGTPTTVTSAVGGIGGIISGGHGRIGPIDLSINCRLGVGGLAISGLSRVDGSGSYRWTSGVVALYGSLDGEIGLHVFPAMMVSVFGGIDALAPIPYGTEFTVLPAPVAGIRVTWGRF